MIHPPFPASWRSILQGFFCALSVFCASCLNASAVLAGGHRLTLKIWCELQPDLLGHFGSCPFGPSDFESCGGPEEQYGLELFVSLFLCAKQVEEGVVDVRVDAACCMSQTTERLPALLAQPFQEQRFCTK